MQWELEIIRWLQSFHFLTQPMRIISILGNEEFFLIAIPLIYWCINSRLGARLAALLIISEGINQLTKLILHASRPYWIDTHIKALSSETTYGIPSAHAQNATSIWGYAARHTKSQISITIVIILLVSLSRVYLGMHFITDVLAGIIIGSITLLVTIQWQSQTIKWLTKRTLIQQIILSFAVSIIYLSISGIVLSTLPTVPSEWIQNAASSNPTAEPIAPNSHELSTTVAGLIFGYGASLALSTRKIQFSTEGSIAKRAMRFAVGTIGTMIIWLGLRYLTPENILALAILVRYLRYAAAMFWILYLAPQIFIRIGLAKGITPTYPEFQAELA